MGNIVRRKVGTPLSAEALERLKQLDTMPDSNINTTDAAEWTEEQWARALKRRDERWQREASALHKKAS